MEYTLEFLGETIAVSAIELAAIGLVAGIVVMLAIWLRH